MSETDKVKAALAVDGGQQGSDASQAGMESELEKARHAKDVWAGRAKQLQEEKKALEEELRRLKAGQNVDDALKSLTPEEKRDTPDDYLGASGRMAAKLVDGARAQTSEEIAALRREMEERDERTFLSNISARHSGFFASVAPGGDKSEYWERFKANNRETYDAVIATRDEARFGALVEGFYRELGIPVPGAGTTAAPTPPTTGGPPPGGGQAETMTTEQYLKELDRAEGMRRAGDMDGWRQINARLKTALNEGRVK